MKAIGTRNKPPKTKRIIFSSMSAGKPIIVISVISAIVISASVISVSLALRFPEISRGRGACIKNIEIQVQMLK